MGMLSAEPMTTQAASLIRDLLNKALESYREEFKDLSETWRHLDTKAQGVGAIAGIFLAALSTWARELPANAQRLEKVAVVACILTLIAAIVAAVLALLIRKVAAPPLGEATAQMVTDILDKHEPEELAHRVAAFDNDQMRVWKEANKDMLEHVQGKALRVTIGQVALVLSALLIAFVAVRFIYLRF